MMLLDDRAADRQADAHTAALGCVEGFENPLKVLRMDASPGISNAQTDFIVSFSQGTDEQITRAIVNISHCVRSVPKQVQDNLLDLDTVTDGRWKVLGEFRPQG